MNRIEFVSIRFYLHLIVTLAAEVEDRLGGGEVRVGVGGQEVGWGRGGRRRALMKVMETSSPTPKSLSSTIVCTRPKCFETKVPAPLISVISTGTAT